MKARWFPILVAALIVPTVANGQQPPEQDLASDIRQIKELLMQLQSRVQENEDDVTANAETIRGQGVQIGQISKRDANGNLFVRLDATQEAMRAELTKAVADVTPKTGTVRIVNATNSDEYIALNGKTYFVMANTELPPIELPIGELRWRGRGESVKRGYMVTPPYVFTITIRPEVQPAVIRAAYSPYYVIQ